uniref:Receptor expression-enhancing protein n=1 Tax=Odontella aurita TaxID=265563 RepID=A0A7S4IT74_9STRA|mmetsp:Transcript_300/g.841  ORF Transcript_300/g.841 Transcript_300/m.841 type:complete len:173 (+) Transcript_300:191-709(+)|eukprot:CAMPEP_0113538616 /NCGR_PEP_ID=MMETSP0015_2-20120614/7466_1 /TAXON_ID=2838 /ORGANISM="Odontella" /LENGTH=172 /DNA_ID=CAMNT_0000438213 /DNA_START=191 /DNA_END=709 /DNA_ORIENTATION=- /assembly_acc=CAM_ASM_000160
MPPPPQVNQALEKVDAFLAKYPSLFQYKKLAEIEKKTGHSKVYFFFLFSTLLSTVIYLLGGPKLISDLVSFLYPAYMSFKTIDSEDSEGDAQWLTYWVVFGVISILETCCSFLVSWIPLYFVLKIAFFIWLWHPKTLGAGVVYTQALRPLLLPYLEAFGTSQKSSTAGKKLN